MKLLFVHDHFFYEDKNGQYYSAGGFPFYLWEKYLDHFDDLIVVGRYGGKIESIQNLVLSSHPKVQFVFVEKFSSLNSLHKVKSVKIKIQNLISKVDAVIVRLPSENGLIAFNFAYKYRKPFAVEVVGCAFDALWYYGGVISKLYAPFLYFRMKNAIKRAKFVLFVSERYLQKKYLTNSLCFVEHASNVDISNFDPQIVYKRINKLNDSLISKKNIAIGIIGNFKTRYKGLHILIESLGIAKRQNPNFNFQLRILGKGDPNEYTNIIEKNRLQSFIIFDGTLPNGDPVLNWLDDIDLYIQPSLTEGLPRSLIEAQSRALICLGSDAGGIPELLDKNFIFKAGNSKALSQKIIEIVHINSLELQQIAKNNFEVSKKYDSKVLYQRRFNFYKSFKESLV